MSIVGKYLHGWESLEPVLLGTLARGMNILLLGSHGCGKSLFARFISTAIGDDDSFRFIKYSMDKENLLSMVGCPNPESMRQGKISYAIHERSIFNADVAMFDELTRAGRENQNMVLEILEEKTVFGMPLKYRFVIATANEDTYKSAYKLDAALLDRFVVVLPVPSLENKNNLLGTEEIAKMIELNQGKREENLDESNKQVREAIKSISGAYDELWANAKLRDNINEFTAKFFSTLISSLREYNKGVGKDSQAKISFRQISSQFVPLLVAISAYYKVVKEDADYLQSGAWDAIKYSIGTKLGYPTDKIRPIFDTLKDLLIDGYTLMTKIIVSVNNGSINSRVTAIEKYAPIIRDKIEFAEKVSIIGNVLNDATGTPADIVDIIRLAQVLEKEKLNDQAEYAAKLRLFNAAVKEGCFDQNSFFF